MKSKLPLALALVAGLYCSFAHADGNLTPPTVTIAGNGLTKTGNTIDIVGTTGGGLTVAADSVGLLATCSLNQTLGWNGTVWGCMDGSSLAGAGDITAVTAGTGLSGGGTTGAVTLNVNIAGGACAAGQSVTSISSTGTATCSANVSSVASGNGINAPTTSGTTTVSVNNGTGLVFATGALTYDNTIIQSRVSGTCTSPNAIASVSATGTVTCTTGVLNTANVSGTTTDLAVFTGTNSVGNFAGSSPAACAAGQVLTRVTSAATGVITLTCTAIGTAGGVTGTGTSGTLAVWSGSTAVGNYAGSTATACGAGNAATQVSIGANGVLAETCSPFGSSSLTNSAGANVIPKSNGTNLVASSIADDGTTVSTTESTILGDTAADSTLVNGTLHEIQTSGSAGLVFGTPTKDWTWYMSGTTAALHEYTGTLGGGGGTDWFWIAAGGATTLNGLTTIQNNGTSTTIVPLALTRTDAATVGDITELDIGQQTAQAKIYTSTTNAGDISALLHMTVRWFNGTDYNNDDFSMGAGGETFSATNPGGPDELDVRNRSNVAGTTTRIATGDGTGYLFSILSDNAGSTTKLMATDRNTAMEFWTGAGGGAKALAIDSSQNVTATNLSTTGGDVDVFGTNWHSILNWTGSTNQDTYIRAGVTAGNIWIGDVNSGGVGIGSTANLTTIYGPLTSTAGANTLGETEDRMTTATNSSGTLTDASFDRTYRGVWWSISGSVTLDGFGFTSGTPTDGQRFAICVIGGGVITMPSEAGGEPTVGRRGNYPGQIIIRSGTCRDFRYDANGLARWKTEGWANTSGIATNNILRTNGGNYEMTSGSITDTASALSWGVPTTITVPSSATGITLNKTASAQTASSNLITVHEADSWNTTAAARTAYGIEADCADSISSGANTLTSVCGYFSNTSSGANINAWALVTDVGDVKLNSTSGSTLAAHDFGVNGVTTLSGTLSALGAATLSGGVTVTSGSLNVNSGAFINAGLVNSDLTHITDKDGTNRPTIANCGTVAPTVVGTDDSGWFVTTTGVAATCAITFHTAYSSNVDCNSWITGAGTTVSHPNLTIATTGLTFAGSSGPLGVGLKVHYECKDH